MATFCFSFTCTKDFLKIMKKKFKYLLWSFFLSILFTFSLYNLFNSEIRVINYVISLSFYFLMAIIFYRLLKNRATAFFITFLPLLLLDLTVFIDGISLIPLRFPFATTFPLLGILAGLFISAKRPLFSILILAGLTGYCIISHIFFIPEIIWKMQNRDKITSNSNIISASYYTVDNIEINLPDTLKAKAHLIELYFVGCAPCEEKYEQIKRLRAEFSSDSLDLILVCEGNTPYDKFLQHAAKKKIQGVTFLYDKTKSLYKNISNLNSFPTEFLFSGSNFYSSSVGFNKETSEKYFQSEASKIKSILQNEK